MSVVLSEHLPLLITAPDGIQKLRGLILELAVSGKLVQQNPEDEPASELLKRAALERVQLEAIGACKKNRPVPTHNAELESPKLPVGWAITNLATVALINPRNTADDSVDVSFVPMAMIGNRFEGSHKQDLRKWGEVKQGFTHFAEGDVGVAKITPCFENSKACVFANLKNGIGAGTTELHIVRPLAQTLVPRYVLAYFKAPMFLAVGETKMTGTAGQKRLPKDFLESNPFPLPPLAEQHRIVAKLDEMMVLCDRLEAEQADAESAQANLVEILLGTLTQSTSAADFAANWQRLARHFDTLFTTESSLYALKQAILQLAVMGRLVSQDPREQPARELLKCIAGERARLEAEGFCKKAKPVQLVGEDEWPFTVPNGWEWARTADVTSQITDGAHHTPTYVHSGIPFLSVKDLSSGQMDFSDTRFISLDAYADLSKRCNPEKGDLLLTKIGTTGIAVLIDTDTKFSIFVSVALLKLPIKQIGSYLQLLINSPLVKKQSSEGTEGVGNKNLVLRKISSFLLPIPPLAEQQRIVTKVHELITLCDRLKTDVAEARRHQERLASTLIESALKAA